MEKKSKKINGLKSRINGHLIDDINKLKCPICNAPLVPKEFGEKLNDISCDYEGDVEPFINIDGDIRFHTTHFMRTHSLTQHIIMICSRGCCKVEFDSDRIYLKPQDILYDKSKE